MTPKSKNGEIFSTHASSILKKSEAAIRVAATCITPTLHTNSFRRERALLKVLSPKLQIPKLNIKSTNSAYSPYTIATALGPYLFKFKYRPIAKIFFIFFLESTFKNKLKSKISEFQGHSLILNSVLKLQRKLFKRFKTFENKRKKKLFKRLMPNLKF